MTDPNPMTLDEVRAEAAKLTRSSGCARPGCTQKVHYRADVRGRRQRFCSGACRAKFSRERNLLHKLLGRLRDTRFLEVPPLPAEEIEVLEKHIEWLLDGYGGFDQSLMYDGMSPLPFASWEAATERVDHFIEATNAEVSDGVDPLVPSGNIHLPREDPAKTLARWRAFASKRA